MRGVRVSPNPGVEREASPYLIRLRRLLSWRWDSGTSGRWRGGNPGERPAESALDRAREEEGKILLEATGQTR
jgi:hypothetical protein